MVQHNSRNSGSGETRRGGETPLWWGDPALVGRPRCGGENLVGTLRVQKGRWARNDPFPFKNYLFLVYSTVADIRDKSSPDGGHSTAHGPLTGPWVRKSTLTGKAPCGGGNLWRFLLKTAPRTTNGSVGQKKHLYGEMPLVVRFLLKTAFSWSTAQ